MNRCILFIIASTLALAHLNPSPLLSPNNQTESINHRNEPCEPEDAPLTIKHYHIGMMMLLLALINAYTLGSETSRAHLEHELLPAHLLATMITTWCDRSITTLCHEYGHALAAQYLNNDPIDIHWGGTAENTLYQCGHITIHGFNPSIGFTRFTNPYINKEDMQRAINSIIDIIAQREAHRMSDPCLASTPYHHENYQQEYAEIAALQRTHLDTQRLAAITLAGSISGMLAHGAYKTIMHFFLNHDGPLLERCTNALRQAASFDLIYLEQLWNMLMPTITSHGARNDAAILMQQCCGLPITPCESDDGLLFVFYVCVTGILSMHKTRSLPLEDRITDMLLTWYTVCTQQLVPLSINRS